MTQNIMEFKKFSAGYYSYGKNGSSYKEYMLRRYPLYIEEDIKNVNFEDPDFYSHMKDKLDNY
jgi:hypothetical protein